MNRIDAYPEALVYRDTGCRESPSCLACPLDACRFDGAFNEARVAARASNMRALRAKGVSITDLARRFSVSPRTVFRILKEEING